MAHFFTRKYVKKLHKFYMLKRERFIESIVKDVENWKLYGALIYEDRPMAYQCRTSGRVKHIGWKGKGLLWHKPI